MLTFVHVLVAKGFLDFLISVEEWYRKKKTKVKKKRKKDPICEFLFGIADKAKTYMKRLCDYRDDTLFNDGIPNGTQTESPQRNMGTYQSSFGTTHKPVVRDQSGKAARNNIVLCRS